MNLTEQLRMAREDREALGRTLAAMISDSKKRDEFAEQFFGMQLAARTDPNPDPNPGLDPGARGESGAEAGDEGNPGDDAS